jgi:prepilin-type processing-associated H-X9-DG protein
VNASEGRLLGRSAAIVGLLLGGLTSLVAVIGTIALILARVQTADARVECANNFRVIGIAVNLYHDDHNKVFPRAVVPLEGVPPEQRASWFASILPYLDAKATRSNSWQSLAGRLDLQTPWDDPANREALTFFVPYYQCPGHPEFDPHNHPGLTHYVGIAGVGDDAAGLPKYIPRAGFFGDSAIVSTLHQWLPPKYNPRAGFFGYSRDITMEDVRDKKGASYKIMAVETTHKNGPWIAGGSPTVRGVGFDPTFLNMESATLFGMLATPQEDFGAPVGAVMLVPRPEESSLIGPGRPFGGCHQGGMNVLMADGSVRFIPDTFPPSTFRVQSSLSDDPAALANLP